MPASTGNRVGALALGIKASAFHHLGVSTGQAYTRIETKCGKCGAPNRVSAAKGETRVTFTCKECGHKQATL